MPSRILRVFPFGLLLVFAMLAGGIAAAGAYYYHSQKEHLVRNEQRDLAAIAALKAKQIADWRGERLSDAVAIRENALLLPSLQAAADPQAPARLRQQLLDWLGVLKRAYNYHEIFLLDKQGRVLAATAATAFQLYIGDLATLANKIDKPLFSQMKRHGDGNIYLDLTVPLRGAVNGESAALLLLRIDPRKFLYPLIQTWPVASDTAESVLSERIGDEVVVLNELRMQKDTALKWRARIDANNPSPMAARGVRGSIETIDYRGKWVYAELSAVPGTDWLLVTKKDREEVLAPLHRDMLTIAGVTVLLISAAWLSAFLLWRQQHVRFELAEAARKQAAAETLRLSEARLAEAQRIARIGNWEWNVVTGELWWSDEVYRILGLVPGKDQPTYEAFLQIVHPEDRLTVTAAVDGALMGQTNYRIQHRVVQPNGSVGFVEETGEVYRDNEQQPVRMVGVVKDITSSKKSEEKILHLSFYDQLTGLPNRTLLVDRLTRALARAKRESHHVAVLCVDLDRFKVINDSLNHHVGDQLLKVVAERLEDCVNETDTVARLGADEFVVVCSCGGLLQDAAHMSGKIQEALARRCLVDGQEFHVTASIGIGMFPNDGEDAETLMRNADIAMHHAKENGRNRYQFFTQQMNQSIFERLTLENSLHLALEREEFELHYQPKIDIEAGRVSGMEALVRWRHPEQGMISPAKFIPLAEESGLIVPLGEWILRSACRQAKEWVDAGLPPLRVAVNISPRQFAQPDLPEVVAMILAETGLDASLLELEVTEGAVMNRAVESIDMLNRFKEMGLTLSIDDFGTGYSSLSYLKLFPIQYLKIDQSFVRDITADPNDAAIVTAVLAMAAGLKLGVIAEGVETAEQLAFLRQQGCREVQGYYFSRPLPTGDFARFIREGKCFPCPE